MTDLVSSPDPATRVRRYALLGNPNTGKTTLFNRLCGVHSHTANYPGITATAREGKTRRGELEILDLPGVYGLNLDMPESVLCRRVLGEELENSAIPDAVLIVVDASNLTRNLVLVAEALDYRLPTVIALNMVDVAERRKLTVDAASLEATLGVPVIPINARGGGGLDRLEEKLQSPLAPSIPLPRVDDIGAKTRWAEGIVESCGGGGGDSSAVTDRLDRFFTHPIVGTLTFLVVMSGLFATIFWLADSPMAWIEAIFEHAGGAVAAIVPAGDVQELLVNGVIGGIAGTLVFLPQILLLFFLLSLLEDTGYLARAALLADRFLRRFGLPGQAFVPLLSSHACAIPGILSARLIPDRRERIATILVAPFMSCSARLPVYVLLIGLIFRDRPLLGGVAFAGCYLLGGVMALVTAALARRSILRGPARPMVLELPSYKRPSFRNALLTSLDRGSIFLRKAGTVILAICMVLWWLSAYPRSDAPEESQQLRDQATRIESSAPDEAAELRARSEGIESRHALAHSFAGRLGRGLEPVLSPIGCDWQLSIAILTSFAAREVFVSTLAVILGTSEEVDDPGVIARVSEARRDDGSLLFSTRSSASLLIFYVLAMQCLPTVVVTGREAGGRRWAFLQLAYMTAVAYAAAWLVFTGLGWMGVA